MSETLPPITGNGVILNFIFPFDDAVERKARICGRRTLGGQHTDTEYGRVEQSGDTAVVLQQVTFKGDAWVAYTRTVPSTLLLLPPALNRKLGRWLHGSGADLS